MQHLTGKDENKYYNYLEKTRVFIHRYNVADVANGIEVIFGENPDGSYIYLADEFFMQTNDFFKAIQDDLKKCFNHDLRLEIINYILFVLDDLFVREQSKLNHYTGSFRPFLMYFYNQLAQYKIDVLYNEYDVIYITKLNAFKHQNEYNNAFTKLNDWISEN